MKKEDKLSRDTIIFDENNTTSLRPLIKWTGGKRKEIKTFSKHFPNFVKENKEYTYCEPFFGGGAVYWYLNNLKGKNIINDLEKDLISYHNAIKNQDENVIEVAEDIAKEIATISQKEKDGLLTVKEAKEQRGVWYYEYRALDRVEGGLDSLETWERALRFILVNQLSFNGMRRFNAKGQFNIPYGNYKSFSNVDLMRSENHIKLLKNTDIRTGSYKDILKENDKENTFIFLDPPYTREFKEYTFGDEFGDKEQRELAEIFKNTKHSKIMIVIDKSDLTMELYKDYIKETYSLKYGTNIKNRIDQDAQHIVVCNY